jgi:hypothetical protein
MAVQRNRQFRPPETVVAWLQRWRPAIEQALLDFLAEDVRSIAGAEAGRWAARASVDAAKKRWREREQHAMYAVREDARWRAGESAQGQAFKRLMKAKKAGDADAVAKWTAELNSARLAMGPIEEAYRARDPEHVAVSAELHAAESALADAERRLTRAKARAEGQPAGRSGTKSRPPHHDV